LQSQIFSFSPLFESWIFKVPFLFFSPQFWNGARSFPLYFSSVDLDCCNSPQPDGQPGNCFKGRAPFFVLWPGSDFSQRTVLCPSPFHPPLLAFFNTKFRRVLYQLSLPQAWAFFPFWLLHVFSNPLIQNVRCKSCCLCILIQSCGMFWPYRRSPSLLILFFRPKSFFLFSTLPGIPTCSTSGPDVAPVLPYDGFSARPPGLHKFSVALYIVVFDTRYTALDTTPRMFVLPSPPDASSSLFSPLFF